MLKRLLFTLSFIATLSANSQVIKVVSKNPASGEYSSIQTALNSITGTARAFVLIKNGTYTEKISYAGSTPVSLIGESADGTIITYNDYSGKVSGGTTISTGTSYTFKVSSSNFYAQNITFKNSSGNVGQAVAVMTESGSGFIFNNCKFFGYQDTYYTNGYNLYNLNCYIEGATDFIFGDANAVFDKCTLNWVRGGWLTAPADTKVISTFGDGTEFLHGLLFRDCNITTNTTNDSTCLGRPWQEKASSVYMNCTLSSKIKKVGWEMMGTSTWNTAFFREYKNKNADGSLTDVSLRVDWSKQLTDDLAAYYNLDTFYYRNKTVWRPDQLITEPAAPTGLAVQGDSLVWGAVSDVSKYLVYRNDSVLAIATRNSFRDLTVTSSLKSTYKIKSISNYGVVSSASSNALEANGALIRISSIVVKDTLMDFLEFTDANKTAFKPITIQLTRKILPSNATDTSLLWSIRIADYKIASIDASTGLLTVKNVGNIEVTVAAKDGSGVSATIRVFMYGTNVANAISSNALIFPNPTSDQIYVKTSKALTVEIYNLQGKMVINESISKTSSIAVAQLPVGVYVVKLRSGDEVRSEYLVKK